MPYLLRLPSFFFKIEDISSFLWVDRYPCFELLVTPALDFKSPRCLVCHLRVAESSDSPLVRHLLTSCWPAWQPSRFITYKCQDVNIHTSLNTSTLSCCDQRKIKLFLYNTKIQTLEGALLIFKFDLTLI